jgi:hypothetical protein
MRPEAFECVEVISGPASFPICSKQGSARGPGIMHLALMASLAAVIVTPQIGVAVYALQSPGIRQTILDQPLVTFQLAVAMAFWIGLFAWPLKGLFDRLTWRRGVEITHDRVYVADTRALGVSQWSAPLTSYKGVAHHIRSSLSGTRHELILVHEDAARSVLLIAANHISETEIAGMTRLLRLPQVPARALYARRKNEQTASSPLFGHAVPA